MFFKFLRQKQKQMMLSIVLSVIEQADDLQISKIIRAVIRRYGLVFPDWDVLFLSVPKAPEQRRSQLERMLEYLKDHNTL